MAERTYQPKLLFVDTSVQIDRVIGEEERRNTIRCNMRNRRVCTCGYVLAEYNQTLVKDAITLRNLVRTSPTVEEAVKRFGRYNPYGRKFPRTVFLLASLGFDSDRQATVERLEAFIEWRARDHFWESMDREACVDHVRCPHTSWQAQQDDMGKYHADALTCLKANPRDCAVNAFIQANRQAIELFVRDAQRSDRAHVTEAAATLDSVLAGRDVPFGIRNCYSISDTLIVLEAPSEAEIYSKEGDIRAISEILGRPVYSEVASAP